MPKMTDSEIIQHNKGQYDALCSMLWDELNAAIQAGRVGKVGVTADVKGDIIANVRRVIDLAENNT